jgi:hypothetical protein
MGWLLHNKPHGIFYKREEKYDVDAMFNSWYVTFFQLMEE